RQRATCRGWSHVAFAPDGQTLAITGSEAPGVKLCDTATLQERARLRGVERAVVCVAYSPDGRLLAGASYDSTVYVWDVATGALRHPPRGHANEVYSVAFAPDGRTLASAGQDRTVKLWDVATGQEKATLTGHTGPINVVAYAP